MKKRAKIIATATVVSITSLIITAYHTESTSSPSSSQNCPVSGVTEVSKTYTPPIQTKPLVAEEMPQISTQIEETKELDDQQEVAEKALETPPPQPIEKPQPTNTPTTTTQTATKPTTSPVPISTEPKMGDTRIIDGKKQSYFLGFGWIDDMGENKCIYVEGMYENGNKIGIMGQSDGDINKVVGTID